MKRLILFFVVMFFFSLPTVKPEYCIGSISLVLSPNSAESVTEVKAIAGGLGGTECYGKIIRIRRDSCSGPNACVCESVGSGCSCSFIAPLPSYSRYGGHRHYSSEYRYYACVDKNNDRDFSDPGEKAYSTLTVRRGLASLPLGILESLKRLFKSILGMFTQVFILRIA